MSLEREFQLQQEVKSLRQQLAAMTKERDKAKAMPMKYRRMEFNAQLQDEAESLRQQLSAAQSEIESAFREGFRSPATYNDVLVNDEDEEWEKYKRRK